MRRALILLTLVAACGTPQERCIAGQTRDLRVVTRLIAETEANLKRGYALEEVTIWRDQWVLCPTPPAPPPEDGSTPPPPEPPRMCLDEVAETVTRPKAIDLAAEAQKLKGLKTKKDELSKAAGPAIAQCKAQYPE